MCEIFSIDSKLIDRLKKKKIYREYIEEYTSMSEQQQTELLFKTLRKYDIEEVKKARMFKKRRSNNGLTQEQVNYIMDNSNTKTRVQIGEELGISADRVSGVINGKYYKDLVEAYYSSRT